MAVSLVVDTSGSMSGAKIQHARHATSSLLETMRDELIDYRGSGMSIMEASHRAKEYDEVNERAMALVREPRKQTALMLAGATATFTPTRVLAAALAARASTRARVGAGVGASVGTQVFKLHSSLVFAQAGDLADLQESFLVALDE